MTPEQQNVMKMALEALNGSQYRLKSYGYQAIKTTIEANEEAITALRQCLEQSPVERVKVWEAEGYEALMQEMQMVKARNIWQHDEIERLSALVRAQQITIDKLEQDHFRGTTKMIEQQPADELRYLKETLDATIEVNAQLKRELALYRMAENERELGLDYDTGWKDGYKQGAWVSEQPAIPAPPEAQTEAEKRAYACGWWKAIEHMRERQPADDAKSTTSMSSTSALDAWVELTKNEYEEVEEWVGHVVSEPVFYAIEAKLREKNRRKT